MARIGLPRLPLALKERTGRQPPNYRICYNGAVGGLFPAHFEGNRWSVDESDLDVIAQALGLTAVRAQRQGTPSRRAAA